MQISQSTKKNTLIILWTILSLVLGIIVILYLLISSGSSRLRAVDARIESDMHLLMIEAGKIFGTEQNYFNVNCDSGNIKVLCDDIAKQTGVAPILLIQDRNICAYTPLKNQDSYYCVDNSNVGIKGICDGEKIACSSTVPLPENSIFKNYQTKKTSNEIIFLAIGIASLVLFFFSIVMLYKRNRIIAGLVILILFIFFIWLKNS